MQAQPFLVHMPTQMDQPTHVCKVLEMWEYVCVVLSGLQREKILLYFDSAHIMYIFSNFALFEVLYILHFKFLS